MPCTTNNTGIQAWLRLLSVNAMLLMAFTSSAQNRPFANYPFEKGGYAIVGLKAEGDPNELRAALGEFYTDDISVLDEFKKTWIFTKKSPAQTCGYHYSIHVTYHGKILQDMLVNLNCQVLATDKNYYFFNSEKLARLAPRLKKVVVITRQFQTKAEGTRYLDSIKTQPGLLLTFEPLWTIFDGKFTLQYPRGNSKFSSKEAEKRLSVEIKKRYGRYPFKLSWLASDPNAYSFEVICNRPLFDVFSLYPKTAWRQYVPELTTVWK